MSEEELGSETRRLPGLRPFGPGLPTERLWSHPAIQVSAIDCPTVALSEHATLPHARAVVSTRIAPDDNAADAAQAITQHLQAHNKWGADLRVELLGSAAP